MANLKNGAIRVMVIDKCLSDKNNQYSTQNIMDACNEVLKAKGEPLVTSLNTIRYDMRTINEKWYAQGGEIIEVKKGRFKYYRYKNQDFSIYHANLSVEERQKIDEAIQILNRFKGVKKYAWTQEMNTRLKTCFTLCPEEETYVSFCDNPETEGKQHITQLFDAIAGKKAIEVIFANQPEVVLTLHPCHLKNYHDRWYLMAWDAVPQEYRVYALDQIILLHTSNNPYCAPEGTDCKELWNEFVGPEFYQNRPLITLKLWAAPEAYAKLEQQPLHSSQKVIEQREDGSRVLEFQVKENETLIQQILSWGEKVVVLEPESIRKDIQGHIWVMGERYANMR